jgi:hypothetical protein
MGGNCHETFRRHHDRAVAVFEDVEVIDDAVRRQFGYAFLQLGQRQAGQVDEIELILVGAEDSPGFGLPLPIEFRVSGDDANALCRRQQPCRDVERGSEVHLDRNADDVRRQIADFRLLLIDGAEDDRHARKHAIAMLQGEIQPRRESGNDEVDLSAEVFLSQMLGDSFLPGGVGKPRQFEVFAVDFDDPARLVLEDRADAAIDVDVAGPPIVGVRIENDDELGFLGSDGGARETARCELQGSENEEHQEFRIRERPDSHGMGSRSDVSSCNLGLHVFYLGGPPFAAESPAVACPIFPLTLLQLTVASRVEIALNQTSGSNGIAIFEESLPIGRAFPNRPAEKRRWLRRSMKGL